MKKKEEKKQHWLIPLIISCIISAILHKDAPSLQSLFLFTIIVGLLIFLAYLLVTTAIHYIRESNTAYSILFLTMGAIILTLLFGYYSVFFSEDVDTQTTLERYFRTNILTKQCEYVEGDFNDPWYYSTDCEPQKRLTAFSATAFYTDRVLECTTLCSNGKYKDFCVIPKAGERCDGSHCFSVESTVPCNKLVSCDNTVCPKETS